MWFLSAILPPSLVPSTTTSRRQVVAGVTGYALAARPLLQTARAAAPPLLPAGVVAELEAGRAVVIPNWLPADELRALRADSVAMHEAGHFKLDALASYSMQKRGSLESSYDRMTMPSFSASKGTDGPWADFSIGDGAARRRFRDRMRELRATLATSLTGRATLAADAGRTHEMSYSRYGPGARLPRHTDEHHAELKRAHSVASGDENIKRLGSSRDGVLGASAATAAAATFSLGTRRSVTWLVYLNDDDWHTPTDGGALRVHERAAPSSSRVGARGADLQVGWLRATAAAPEQPVFLDAWRGEGGKDGGTEGGAEGGAEGGGGGCMLYACAADGSQRDLSRRPFRASPALYLAGGDFFARRLLVDDPADASRFHLCDAPKSDVAAALLPPVPATGEDGGERVRDIAPEGGTLVLFDSVAVPHEVMAATRRPRLACTGWFHEQLFA